MTQFIFQDWLTKFNNRMFLERRIVLLLLDNAGHGSIDKTKYSNVAVDLPANTTSHL